MSPPSTRAPCRIWTICSVPGGRCAVTISRCLGSLCSRHVSPNKTWLISASCPGCCCCCLFVIRLCWKESVRARRVCSRGLEQRAVTADPAAPRHCSCRTFIEIHPPAFAFGNLPPALSVWCVRSRSQTAVAPFCSWCLQSGGHGARSGGCAGARGAASRRPASTPLLTPP